MEPYFSRVLSPAVLSQLWKLLIGTLAVFMTCSGMILMLSLTMQFGGASAKSMTTATFDKLMTEKSVVREIHIPSYTKLRQPTNGSVQVCVKEALATSLYRAGAGIPWDTCAGINMFNSPDPFYCWDASETRYKINGATASEYSKGSGRVLIGFAEPGEQDVEWYEAPGVFVPGLSESLLCSVWFALERGIFTTVNAQPFIMTCSGKCVPLEVQNNVTRCKHIKLWSRGMPFPAHIVSCAPGLPSLQKSTSAEVDAQTAVSTDNRLR